MTETSSKRPVTQLPRCKRLTIPLLFLAALSSNIVSVALLGAWDEPPRKGDGLDLNALVDFDEVAICPPIVQEILQGTNTMACTDIPPFS